MLPLSFAVLAACSREDRGERPARILGVGPVEALSLESPSLEWPQFLLAEATDRFLWGEGNEISRVTRSAQAPHRVVAEPVVTELTEGLDKLAAAARTPQGTLAFLDAAGKVVVHRPASGETWRLVARLENRPGALALTEHRIYLLLQGEAEESSAVVAYDYSGTQVGRWGTMPADGILQANLSGGGIAACPDGSVYYSYINSPRILKLEDGTHDSVPLGRANRSFRELSERQVRAAFREGERTGSTAPLVQLGLTASRVMALGCSAEGLLFRHIAQPKGGGTRVEVWDPRTGEAVGTIAPPDGILLAVVDRTLYFGGAPEGGKFVLYRMRWQEGART